jgi:LysM repeat protein
MALLTLLGIEKLTSIYDTLTKAIESFEEDLAQEAPPEEVAILDQEGQSRAGSAPRPNSKRALLLAGAVVVVLVLVELYFLVQGAKKGPEVDLQPLLKRIGLLEEKMAKLEGKGRDLPQVQENLDSLTKNLNERLSHLEKDINQIKEEATSGKKKTELAQPTAPRPAAPPRSSEKPGGTRFHTVAKGENLFRIALRYNLTVDELRRLNNLKPDQSLQVGQKLKKLGCAVAFRRIPRRGGARRPCWTFRARRSSLRSSTRRCRILHHSECRRQRPLGSGGVLLGFGVIRDY